jgi:hypothetical protein
VVDVANALVGLLDCLHASIVGYSVKRALNWHT